MIGRIAHSVKRDPVIWFLGLVSMALVAAMDLLSGRQFAKLLPGETLPDSHLAPTMGQLLQLRGKMADCITAKAACAPAADILHRLHLYWDMLLPAALGATLFLTIARAAKGSNWLGRPINDKLRAIFLVMPIFYAIADYAENVLALKFFPPATPSFAQIAVLAEYLSLATRLKFMFLFIAAIIALRLVAGHMLFEKKNDP